MINILSIGISAVSIIIGVGIIKFYGNEGSFMLLSILGAPSTFLQRIFWIFGDTSTIPLYGMYILYFIQYQLLAFGIYKYYSKLNFPIYTIIIGIIIISAIIMYCFQMGKFV